ncbi:MAG: hypothetical protein H6711_17915 [Myxococcales bacterium]|nr:hypothetical protein [Myxococcales bacterium]
MAEITIRLRHNRKTGERELVVHYESESDALPHEHERDHRKIAEALLGRPLDEVIGAAAVDRVIVERGPVAGSKVAEAEGEAESGAQGGRERAPTRG